MAAPARPIAWLGMVRRHERRLAGLWLGLSLLLLGSFAVGSVRVRLLATIGRAADWWDARWDRRLVAGGQMVAQGRFDQAIGYLEQLDRIFPARTSRYGRDQEREYLLRLLAQSYEALGRNGRTMAVWSHLVAFDSLNYRNHFGSARAAERLLSGWAEAPEARDGYARALRLLPSHLPSLRGYLRFYMDRGEFREVREAYRVYLDAFLVGSLTIRGDGVSAAHSVRVDGRPHELLIPLTPVDGWNGTLTFSAGPYQLAIEEASVSPPMRVGQTAPGQEHLLPAPIAARMIQSGAGWVPEDSSAGLRVVVPPEWRDAGSLRLRVRVFNLIDEASWKQFVKGYRNLLDYDGLAEAERRTAPFRSPAAADSAFARLDWAPGGVFVPGTK